jgi:hypothetical protein
MTGGTLSESSGTCQRKLARLAKVEPWTRAIQAPFQQPSASIDALYTLSIEGRAGRQFAPFVAGRASTGVAMLARARYALDRKIRPGPDSAVRAGSSTGRTPVCLSSWLTANTLEYSSKRYLSLGSSFAVPQQWRIRGSPTQQSSS